MATFNAYPAATLPLSGSEVLVVAQGGNTVNTTVSQLLVVTPGLDPTGQTNSAAAIAAQLEATGYCYVPPGDYLLATAQTLLGTRSYRLIGAGQGQVRFHVTQAGAAFTFPQALVTNVVELSGFKAIAENAAGATASFASITFPVAASVATPTLLVRDVVISSAASGWSANCFTNGFSLLRVFRGLLDNVTYVGGGFVANEQPAGTGFLAITDCNTLKTTNCGASWGDAFMYVTESSASSVQGLAIEGCVVIATNWMIRQNPSDATLVTGIDGIWINDCEIATIKGGFQLLNSLLLLSKGLDIAAWSGPPSNRVWTAYDLTNCFRFQCTQDQIFGGGSNSKAYDLKTTVGVGWPLGCSENTFSEPRIMSTGLTVATLGANTTHNYINNATPRNLSSNAPAVFTDSGTNNGVTFVSNVTGLPSNNGNWNFAANDGANLLTIANVPAAQDTLVIVPGPGTTNKVQAWLLKGTDDHANLEVSLEGPADFIVRNNASFAGTNTGDPILLISHQGTAAVDLYPKITGGGTGLSVIYGAASKSGTANITTVLQSNGANDSIVQGGASGGGVHLTSGINSLVEIETTIGTVAPQTTLDILSHTNDVTITAHGTNGPTAILQVPASGFMCIRNYATAAPSVPNGFHAMYVDASGFVKVTTN